MEGVLRFGSGTPDHPQVTHWWIAPLVVVLVVVWLLRHAGGRR